MKKINKGNSNKSHKKSKKVRVRTVKEKYDTKTKVLFIVFMFFCISVIVGVAMLARYLIITYKYSYYTDKMEWYGYNFLYDNESAKSTDSVLSDEIAKMVAGVLYNKTSRNFAKTRLYGDNLAITDVNESWITFAKTIPLKSAEDIVIGDKASKFQAASLIVEGIEIVYGRDVEVTEQLKEKYRSDYTEEELVIIDKAISLGILKNSKNDVNKYGLIKGELNQMLIIVAEKYSMMYYNSRDLDGDEASIVTDESKQPVNADKYPYIVDNIVNDIYEIEMPEMLSEISQTPKEVYEVYSDVYDRVEENLVEFFDVVLNVDYRTIETEDFIESINQYVSYDINSKVSGKYVYREKVENYVNYVKENEIILSGKVTPQLPIVYSNGMLHFVRCRIEFKVVNSNTNDNLLLWDSGVTYNSKEIDLYSDVVVTPSASSKAFRVCTGLNLLEYIAKDINGAVTK